MEIVDYCYGGRGLSLFPFGCVHYGHPNHHKGLWADFLKKADSPDALLIGMGDYLDYARRHYRAHILAYVGDDTSQQGIDKFARGEVQEFAKFLEPHKKRIIGLLEGNHYWKFSDGTTSTQYLCQLLGVRYMADAAFIRLHFEKHGAKGNRGYEQCIVILCNHGQGSGGSYMASDVGKFERNILPGFDADIYLSSHSHRKFACQIPQLGVQRKGRKALVTRPRVIAKTGCFLQSYCEGVTSYVDQKLYTPTEIGWIELEVSTIRRRDGNARTRELNIQITM